MLIRVGLDHLCSAQDAELTTKRETPAMFLGPGLWPRDSQDVSPSQSGVGAAQRLGLTLSSAPHFTSPKLRSTLPAQTTYFPVILLQQAVNTAVPC